MKLQRTLVRNGLAAGALSALAVFAISILRRRRRGVQFFKSLRVSASPDAVYDFWTRFENFPDCFSSIKEVRRTGKDNEWRWTIVTPAGRTLEWDAWVTESIPNKSIAWESAPGAPVKSVGVVQFTPAGLNATRVDVRMSYAPANRTAVGALASAFGHRPQAGFNESLARLQSRFDEDIPTGKEPTA